MGGWFSTYYWKYILLNSKIGILNVNIIKKNYKKLKNAKLGFQLLIWIQNFDCFGNECSGKFK